MMHEHTPRDSDYRGFSSIIATPGTPLWCIIVGGVADLVQSRHRLLELQSSKILTIPAAIEPPVLSGTI